MTAPAIPYGRHLIEEDDVEAVVRVLRSDRLTGGPVVEEFEEALARYCGRKHAVATSSGTTALYCAYMEADVDGVLSDTIRVPAITFAATATAAMHAGYYVKFVDVDPERLTLDWQHVRGEHCVVPVDYAGLHAGAGGWIYDCAHSLGARDDKGKPATTHGVAACLSFHPVKAIAAGEGGAVVTDDPAIAARVAALRDHGRASNGDVRRLSLNFRMSAIHAALALSQLGKIERFIQRREAIAAKYSTAFAGLPITLPAVPRPPARHAWHLYVIRVPAARRNRFQSHLATFGVQTQVHYKPVYDHALFVRERRPCQVADVEAKRAISIPIFPGMTDEDVERVIEAVKDGAERLL